MFFVGEGRREEGGGRREEMTLANFTAWSYKGEIENRRGDFFSVGSVTSPGDGGLVDMLRQG